MNIPQLTTDQQMAHTVQRHMKEAHQWEPTLEELLSEPRYLRVWAHWNALAYFREKNYYPALEEAPEGLEWVSVMGEVKKDYRWEKGEYLVVQHMTIEDCKKIYGD